MGAAHPEAHRWTYAGVRIWSPWMASSPLPRFGSTDLESLKHEGVITRILDDGYAYVDEQRPSRKRYFFSFSRSIPNYRGESARELKLTKGTQVRYSRVGNEIQRIAVGPDCEGFLISR